MVETLDQYFPIVMPIFLGLAAIQMFVYHRRGTRIEGEFRQALDSNIKFRERGVSGRRKRPFSLGGANGVLEVLVTDSYLCIKGIWPIFTSIGKHYGLAQLVPLLNIRSVELRGGMVEISFVDESGRDCVFAVRLRNPSAFKKATSRVA